MIDLRGRIIELQVSDPWDWGTQIGTDPIPVEVLRVQEVEDDITGILVRLVTPVSYEGNDCRIFLIKRRLAGRNLSLILEGEDVPCGTYHVPTDQFGCEETFDIDAWLSKWRGGIGLIGTVSAARDMGGKSKTQTRVWVRLAVIVLLLFLVSAGVHVVRGVYLGPWLEVETRDQFAILYDSAVTYLAEENRIADSDEIGRAMRSGYTERTGLETPTDGWGRPITVAVAFEGDRCIIELHSDGRDGIPETGDDVDQRVEFMGARPNIRSVFDP